MRHNQENLRRGTLFTDDFLTEGIASRPEWQTYPADRLDALKGRLKAVFAAFPTGARQSEADTNHELIFKVLDALGWPYHTEVAAGRHDIPDVLLYGEYEAKAEAAPKAPHERFRHAVSILESKRWQRPLDRTAGEGPGDGVPSTQILRYLSRAEVESERRIQWGMLTNGRHWRLYFQGARSRAEEFLEIDLPVVLEVPGVAPDLFSAAQRSRPDHWLKLFALFFGPEGFRRGADGRTLHQIARDEGRTWEARVTRDLSDTVFDHVFPELIRALVAGDPQRPAMLTADYLSEARQSALVLLYRLLFLLYAEDRNLLPVFDQKYDDYGLRTRVRQDIRDRVDSTDTSFAAEVDIYFHHVRQLCHIVDTGAPTIGLPPYDGGLFDPRGAPMLERVWVPDALFAPLLDRLSRREEAGQRKWINYRDLSVEQLGSIYERLLEFEPVVENGRIEIRPNDYARKSSGSYYTPDELVRLIIDRAVGPLVDERIAVFDNAVSALIAEQRPIDHKLARLRECDAAEAIIALKVCDPAMGSGHFLVSLVDYLSDRVLQAMADAESAVPWLEADATYVSPLAERMEKIRIAIRMRAAEAGWSIQDDQLDDKQIVRRIILKRVIYGVDKNPMAVELAKLALWLHTFTVGAPLSFLDHHLRCGDSLCGEWLHRVLDDLRDRGELLIWREVRRAKGAAIEMQAVEKLTDTDISEVMESREHFEEMTRRTAPLSAFLDFWHALRWQGLTEKPKQVRRKRGAVGNHEDQPAAREERKRNALEAFLDGVYGDPVRVVAGQEPLRAPVEAKPLGLLPDDAAHQEDMLPAGKGNPQDYALLLEILSEAERLSAEERFLHWEIAFPGVWNDWESKSPKGGFDAVIGNPPYVRQEAIGKYKPVLSKIFETYHGTADLYVYFYEQGLNMLRPGGRLSFVVTNKWMRAGYGAPLRHFMGDKGWIDTIVDFGHAKQFFPDADVFPSVVVVRRPDKLDTPKKVWVCVIPREKLDIDHLPAQVRAEGFSAQRVDYGEQAWHFEPEHINTIIDKISNRGVALEEYVGDKPYRGIVTGFNDAFVIDANTKAQLVKEDPKSVDLLKPYVRGQDIKRWNVQWQDLWLIFSRRGIEIEEYHAIFNHLTRYRQQLEPKPAGFTGRKWPGRKPGSYIWYEIQDSIEFFNLFESPKIMYQEIQFHSAFAFDDSGFFGNNKTFMIPGRDLWLLCVLNSPLMWWYNWRYLPHMKDEALSPVGYKMERLPIANALKQDAAQAHDLCSSILEKKRRLLDMRTSFLEWLALEIDVVKNLQNVNENAWNDAESLIRLLISRAANNTHLSPKQILRIKDAFHEIMYPGEQFRSQIQEMEKLISNMVMRAYQLDANEVEWIWKSAPPRMPLVSRNREESSDL